MKSAGPKQLVATVEQTTGYEVVVDTVEDIGEDAQMGNRILGDAPRRKE